MLTMACIHWTEHAECIYTTHDKQIAKPIHHDTRKYQLRNLGKNISFCQRIPKFTLSLDSLSRIIKAYFNCILDNAHGRTQMWEFMIMNKMTGIKNTQKHPHHGQYSFIQPLMFQVIKDITDTTKEGGILEWEKFLHCISWCSIFYW